MSTLEVNTINPQSGTTITIGGSGDTVTLGSGAIQSGFGGVMTPSFHAYRTSSQTVSSSTWTKIQMDIELFDSDGMYDNSTNYRFQPTTAGKYFIYASTQCTVAATAQYTAIYKNGSAEVMAHGNGSVAATINCQAIIDFNGSTDYVEAYSFCQGATTSNHAKERVFFGGFKIIQ